MYAPLLLLSLLVPQAETPRVPGESWQVFADPAQAGFDAAALAELRGRWQETPSSAFLIVADGAIVAAWGDIERRFMCHSVRKSFLSALYGVRHDRGEIDLALTLADLGIDDIEDGLTEGEQAARIEDLLRARSGVYRLAAYEPPQNPKPERHAYLPGHHWCYNNWDFNSLSTIFRQITGEDVFEAFDADLARPLGLEDWRVSDGYYHYESEKSEHPAYPFRMSARDMARIGVLFLREGQWGEDRVLSRSWVRRSTISYSDEGPFTGGYGYMWWIFSANPRFEEVGMYSALGVGNQTICVLPEVGLVIVNRANTYDRERTPGPALMSLVEGVLDARVGEPDTDPMLAAWTDAEPIAPAAITEAEVEALCGTFAFPAPLLGFPERGRPEWSAGEGHLVFHTPTRGTFRWWPLGDGRWLEEDTLRECVPVHGRDGTFDGFATLELLVNASLQAEVRGDLELGVHLLAQAEGVDVTSAAPIAAARMAQAGGEAGDLLDRFLAAGYDAASLERELQNIAQAYESLDAKERAGVARAQAAVLRKRLEARR